MIEAGAIVRIFAPQAGYKKYHLCLCAASADSAAKFLFINSDPNFEDLLVVPCERLAMLPRSETGKSCFSFSMVPRFTAKQLELYNAEPLGRVDKAMAKELRAFADTVRSLPRRELDFVKEALDSICAAAL